MEWKRIDLSMDIYHGAPTFANDPVCEVVAHSTVASIGYNITRLSLSTHQGTHLDAPYHFFDRGGTVDGIPLDTVAGPAFKVDLTDKRPGEPIGVADLLPHASRVRKGARVILQTGWDRMYPAPAYFSDFPYVTMELADWFAGREIALLGMDLPTPNPKDWLVVHHALLGKGIVLVEGLAHLERIVRDEFLFVAAPLRILGRDGSPVRALALEAVGAEDVSEGDRGHV